MSTNIEMKNYRIQKYEYLHCLDKYKSLKTIIMNVSDVCDRHCTFCPRSHGYKTPADRNTFMSMEVVNELAKQVDGKFFGTFSISGFGEPMFNKELKQIVGRLNKTTGHTCLTTNGYDCFRLGDIGADKIDISVYSEKDAEYFNSIFDKLPDCVNLKMQYRAGNTFFNNRAGNAGAIENIPENCCYITFMKLSIDTNGDILQCCSDWKREYVLGNLFTDNIWDIWIDGLQKDRQYLINNERHKCKLCSKCNSPGDLYGIEFKNFWEKYYREHQ